MMGTFSYEEQIWPEISEDESEEMTENIKEQVCADTNQTPLSTNIGDPSQNSIERRKKKEAARCCPRTPLCSFSWSRWSKTFKWKIEGFSLLLPKEDIGEPSRAKSNFISGAFDAHGFTWQLELRVGTLINGKSCISFYLTLVSPPHDLILVPEYQLIIYNLLNNKKTILLKGENRSPFCKASKTWGFPNIMEVEAFKSTEGGFVVNDSCVLGAKIGKFSALDLQLKPGAYQCSLLKEVDHAFSWEIHGLKNILALHRPNETTTKISPTFDAEGFVCHLKLYPKENGSSKKRVKYMSLYLFHHQPSNLLKSPVYVEFYLEMKSPINDGSLVLKPKVGRHVFTSEAYSRGWPNFLPLKYIPADDCIFHLKITKLGLYKNSNDV